MWPFSKKDTPPPIPTSEDAAVLRLPPKPLHKHQTAADQLDYWCKRHKATYERYARDGVVFVRVHLPEGDTFAGKGATTLEAVVMVCKKLGATP